MKPAAPAELPESSDPASFMPPPRSILRGPALRAIETQQRNAAPTLMERAGQAATQVATELLMPNSTMPATLKPLKTPSAPRTSRTPLTPLIIAGPGNNGGDAFVVARLLGQAGWNPVVVFVGEKNTLPVDARNAYDVWLATGGSLTDCIPDDVDFALAIDGLFGIGLGRPIEGCHAALVQQINRLDCPILALDIPSGIDSETGRILGVAVRATHTATFIALKPGLLTLDGPDHCGNISVHDLALAEEIRRVCDGATITPALFDEQLRPRPRNTHKGSFGSVGILGGAPGMAGAALLAGRAALTLGAGRVHVGMLERLAVDPQQPELMLREAQQVMELATCLAIGPGLGQSEAALHLLQHAIDSSLPLLLDADALNLLAAHTPLLDRLAQRNGVTLLTPHPTEAARLLMTDTNNIQADRLAAAMTLARRCNATTLLKGCGSVIALPDGRWFINTSGNAGLASAGSGDVLSGMIAALLAQGWPAAQALLAATHLHGCAADACVAMGIGPIGLCAGELIAPARRILNQWVARSAGAK